MPAMWHRAVPPEANSAVLLGQSASSCVLAHRLPRVGLLGDCMCTGVPPHWRTGPPATARQFLVYARRIAPLPPTTPSRSNSNLAAWPSADHNPASGGKSSPITKRNSHSNGKSEDARFRVLNGVASLRIRESGSSQLRVSNLHNQATAPTSDAEVRGDIVEDANGRVSSATLRSNRASVPITVSKGYRTLRWLEQSGVLVLLGLLADGPGEGLTIAQVLDRSGLCHATSYAALRSCVASGLIGVDLDTRKRPIVKRYRLTVPGHQVGALVQDISRAMALIPPPEKSRSVTR